MATTSASTPTRSRNQGKTGFIKEFLHDHPKSNPDAVNEAWTEAGMEGSISASMINKIRSELGLAGNLRPGPKKQSKTKHGTRRASISTASSTPGRQESTSKSPSRSTPDRSRLLADLDADLDRLIFRVMELSELSSVANRLREARRDLYRTLDSTSR